MSEERRPTPITPEDYLEHLRNQGMDFLEVEEKITDQKISDFVIDALELYAPYVFFTQPASMSSKYHPNESLGIGGLLRHTKSIVLLAESLFPLQPFDEYTQDLILAAAYLHDMMKPSTDHPIEVRLKLEPLKEEYYDIYKAVIPLIESHTGQWDNFGKFPRPRGTAQKFLHMCDLISSQKFIHIDTTTRD